MPRCELCGEGFEDDPKVFGKHLWEQHRLTPNDYRTQHLGLPPKCKRPGCEKPVPRDADGRWFACCSPPCAMEMGEDIPVGPGAPSGGEPGALTPKQIDEAHDWGQVIMSARVCGTLFLVAAVYALATGAKFEWTWELIFPVAGLAMFVFGFANRLPEIPPKAEPPDRTPDSSA